MSSLLKATFVIAIAICATLTVSAQKTFMSRSSQTEDGSFRRFFLPDEKTNRLSERGKLPNNDCLGTISRSVSIEGENGEVPSVSTKPNEFNIIIDPRLQPVNFKSFLEKHYRSQGQKLDTSAFYLTIPDWGKLSSAQKLAEMEKQRVINEAKADTAHKVYNIKHLLIYMVNNTSSNVALQMQDGSFIGLLEARIDKNQWRAVQYLSFSWCGNSYRLKHIGAGVKSYFAVPTPTGNYKATLRYKILGKDKFYYSNEFEGEINYCDLQDNKHSAKEKLEAYAKYYID